MANQHITKDKSPQKLCCFSAVFHSFPFSCFQILPIFQKIEFKQMSFQWALKSISLKLWSTVIRNVDKHTPVEFFLPTQTMHYFRNRKSSKTTIDLHCLTPQHTYFATLPAWHSPRPYPGHPPSERLCVCDRVSHHVLWKYVSSENVDRCHIRTQGN